ncbi:MAG TPA: UDP-3-O-(3-hydroxymyristoyl)glucosamine N-acyltransferase [Bacteroidia bacterium]|nr:UDP-3-O-(3-hydroxymyristoyl)glucosamine N-acyltransferase [Bacteroidia bacterium]HNT81158.1 UDP-3-O-(3-hydroxymyristoyl)glucosamine N-acyltransferase [Bacteroidia bacterium]
MKLNPITAAEIIKWHEEINGKVKNFGLSDGHMIRYPRAIELCDEHNISMITSKYKDQVMDLLSASACRLIIIPESLLPNDFKADGKAFLLHDKPKEILIQYCKSFLGFGALSKTEDIHASAVIEKGAKIGLNVVIGAHTFISSDSEVGDHCMIGANTVIKNATIANRVMIGSNNTIGENGFGYTKDAKGESELFPHYGRVVIEDDVHIGNNTCIDRGSLSDTHIMKGVKIDNLVHIAHNVVIGQNSFIIACSMIAGSVVIGENCWVAPSSSIRNALNIGKNATIGIASTVVKNVEAGTIVLGNPAMKMDDFVKLRKQQNDLIADQKTKASEEGK